MTWADRARRKELSSYLSAGGAERLKDLAPIWARALHNLGGDVEEFRTRCLGDRVRTVVGDAVATLTRTASLVNPSRESSRAAAEEVAAAVKKAGIWAWSEAMRGGKISSAEAADLRPGMSVAVPVSDKVKAPQSVAGPENNAGNVAKPDTGNGNACKPFSGNFLDHVFTDEQGGRTGDARDIDEYNTTTHARGMYQFLPQSLREIGWMDGNNHWTETARKNGVRSDHNFLNSKEIQNKAAQAYFEKNYGYVKALDVDGKNPFELVGTRVAGKEGDFTISEAGLMAAAHRHGAGKLKKYLDYMKASNWGAKATIPPEWEAKLAIKRADGKVIRSADNVVKDIEQRLRDYQAVNLREE
jgi:hypothetical protein